MLDLRGYQIKEELYSGARSLIYQGIRELDHLPVIIKLHANTFPRTEDLDQHHREFEIGKNLQHDHIIQYYSIERYKHGLAIITENFNAVSLSKIIKKKPFSVEQFLPIAIQFTSALLAIHQENIIHKDIKPQNAVINVETQTLKLIDFGIASQLETETQTVVNPNRIEGSLLYMSPEQTGRMNRDVDYRTDLYSLGVSFYELLSGKPPFTSLDPLEVVHFHIARKPIPLHIINFMIPVPLSNIVNKLLSKNAEDRYQSAYGLKADLELCLEQLQNNSVITDIQTGQQDQSSKFKIHQKLYGRDNEIKILLDNFNDIRTGQKNSVLMLVAGYSGVGKTFLIHEIHKPLTEEKGYFISGKFDQFLRNIPYASFIHAFQELVRILLTETPEQLAVWKQKLLDTLGQNGQVIINVIPEVELLIGEQPPTPELGATENQNRFSQVFQNFIYVFAKKEHPLVIFLDDLQWADLPTLNLLELLMTDPDCHYLYFIGAYRDNEVDDSHALIKTLKEIQKKRTIENIFLQPLTLEHVNTLTSETLGCEPSTSLSLAELVYQKTNGNPFFMTMFLTTLYQEKLLYFVQNDGCWKWNLQEIEKIGFTDNVVDLMVRKINKLPNQTQEILAIAAMIGNEFDLQFLSLVYQKSFFHTAKQLWIAIQEGFIYPLNHNYKKVEYGLILPLETKYEWIEQHKKSTRSIFFKFLHDRVQQASNSFISEKDKPKLHLKIGKLLLEYTKFDKQDEHLFEIVDHLNKGYQLISDPEEKQQLIQLNLNAAKKAKKSSAYAPALKYITSGMNYLPQDSWASNYDLTLSYYLEKGEIEYLNANWNDAIETFNQAHKNVHTVLERCKISEYKTTLYRMKNDLNTALNIGIEALAELGIDLKAFPDVEDLQSEIIRSNELFFNQDTEYLFNLPELTDPLKLSAMALLRECFSPAYFLGSNLTAIIGIRMNEITLRDGNNKHSSVGYIFYSSVTLAVIQQAYDQAYQFGLLSLRLNDEKYQVKEYEALILDMWGSFACPYKKPLKISCNFLSRGFYSGLENGSYQWAGYCAVNLLFQSFWGSDNIKETIERINSIIPSLRKVDQNMAQYYYAIKATIHNLTHEVEDWSILPDTIWPNATAILEQCHQQNDLLTPFVDAVCKLSLANWNHAPNSDEYAIHAEKYLIGAPGIFLNPVFHFHQSIAYLSVYLKLDEKKQAKYEKVILENIDRFKIWSKHCPETYQHYFDLIQAEYGRVKGHSMEKVAAYYDSAIQLAGEYSFTQDQAFACELAAKYYQTKGRDKIAHTYIKEAYYNYHQWGATTKVIELEKQFPELFQRSKPSIQESSSSFFETSDSRLLDIEVIVRTSQAISSEIQLDKLLFKIMKLIIESAGAQKGFLILKKGDEFFIEASKLSNCKKITTLESIPIIENPNLSESIIQYTARTGKNTILNDAPKDKLFGNDPYILEKNPISILCIPILHKEQFKGVLYLENNLTTYAFSNYVDLLQVLLSQAAISLDNAQLYNKVNKLNNELEQRVIERTQDLERSNTALMESLETTQKTQKQLIAQEKMASLG
ncbi:MAG: putative ATPase/GAF domain-containing protein, partial [bacterium]